MTLNTGDIKNEAGTTAEAAKEMGIQLGAIIKSPMEGLIKYHN
jgi:hypothetical protein